jgi:signal transduction histidine kinase
VTAFVGGHSAHVVAQANDSSHIAWGWFTSEGHTKSLLSPVTLDEKSAFSSYAGLQFSPQRLFAQFDLVFRQNGVPRRYSIRKLHWTRQAGRWRQYHAIIATEVQRLTRLTENLRLLSHLETKDAPLVREPVNLKGVIEDVIMAQYETAEARRVRLRYVGPERPARVLGDRDRLRQVLLNLVDNGIKYSKPDGGEVIISIQEEHNRLCVRVSDAGIGIAEEDLPHIFGTAYRAPDARTLRRAGSGLGLAIVKRIVEQHGGALRVQSRLDEGTTMSFDLPMYVPA